ncbi:MAG TPA: GNAT family protein [Methylomirabilota bacterium]
MSAVGTERSLVTPVSLEGRWVRLEPLAATHIPGLLAAASGPRDTYGFTTVPGSPDQMAAYVAFALAEQEAGRALAFATVDRSRDRVVGCTRFFDIEFWPWVGGNANQRGVDRPDAVEIGWTWLAADAQRTPINTEAKLLMLSHAFDHWRVHRVSLMTDARNQRSRNAILRLGARFDGVLRGDRAASDGTIRDTAAFSILESEWPAVRSNLQARLGR